MEESGDPEVRGALPQVHERPQTGRDHVGPGVDEDERSERATLVRVRFSVLLCCVLGTQSLKDVHDWVKLSTTVTRTRDVRAAQTVSGNRERPQGVSRPRGTQSFGILARAGLRDHLLGLCGHGLRDRRRGRRVEWTKRRGITLPLRRLRLVIHDRVAGIIDRPFER